MFADVSAWCQWWSAVWMIAIVVLMIQTISARIQPFYLYFQFLGYNKMSSFCLPYFFKGPNIASAFFQFFARIGFRFEVSPFDGSPEK